MYKQLIAAFILCASVVTSAVTGVQAVPPTQNQQSSEQTSSESNGLVLSTAERLAEKKEELDVKKQALEQQIAERKAAVTEKLSGKSIERCEQRESKINKILDDRTAAAQRHFDTFKSIEDKLVAFVAEKNLTIDDEGALEIIMQDKAEAAQLAIDSVGTATFNCEEASAAAPGAIVMGQVASAKQALKDYRTAIKDYATAVKSAVQAPEPTTEVTQ